MTASARVPATTSNFGPGFDCLGAALALYNRVTVTRREADGRFAFVLVTVEGDVSFEPKPDDETIAALLAKAERDCFVGASLTAAPAYTWTVA